MHADRVCLPARRELRAHQRRSDRGPGRGASKNVMAIAAASPMALVLRQRARRQKLITWGFQTKSPGLALAMGGAGISSGWPGSVTWH